MKKFILFLLFLCFISAAQASYRDITINTNALTLSDLLPGPNVTMGAIVLSTQIINSTTVDINKNIDTGIYDSVHININDNVRLSSNLTNSIMLNQQLLQPGQQMQIAQIGDYIFYETLNQTVQGHVYVEGLPYPTIQISIDSSSIYNITFDKNNFELVNETVVRLNLSSNFDLKADTYKTKIHIKDKTIDLNFSVKKYYDFYISNYSCISLLQLGTSDALCSIDIVPQANDYFNINTRIMQNITSFTRIPATILLYPGITQTVKVLYDISNVGQILTYNNATIDFYSTTKTQTINFSFSVSDTQYPYTEYCSLIENSSYQSEDLISIKLKPYDNIGISNVWGEIRIRGSDTAIQDLLFVKKGTEYWSSYSTKDVNDYSALIHINDTSGNINTTEYFLKIEPKDCIFYSTSFNFGRVKYEKFSRPYTLLNLTKNLEVIIRVPVISYENASWEMKFVSNGIEKSIRNDTNGEIIFNATEGPITVEFRGDKLGQYTGEFLILTPVFAKSIPRITFSGEIINYDVPSPFSDENFFGGKLDCVVKDTGTYEDSYFRCSLDFPITTNINEAPIPITAKVKSDMEKSYQDKIDEWKNKNTGKMAIIIFLVVMCGVIVFIVYWIIYQNPFIFWKWR